MIDTNWLLPDHSAVPIGFAGPNGEYAIKTVVNGDLETEGRSVTIFSDQGFAVSVDIFYGKTNILVWENGINEPVVILRMDRPKILPEEFDPDCVIVKEVVVNAPTNQSDEQVTLITQEFEN